MFDRWEREHVVDSFVEWYDCARQGEVTGVRSALAAFESYRAPRAWVTLVAIADREGA